MKEEDPENVMVIAAFYKFARLADYEDMKEPLLAFCLEQGLKGTILLAQEGINSTISGRRAAIEALMDYLRADARLADLTWKESFDESQPFNRMKVKLKREIVTMGVPQVDPEGNAGEYVSPQEWNDLIEREDVLLIDTRNDYEIDVGTFKGAVSPDTQSFREFPAYVEKHLKGKEDQPVAMFCTGGIRCEKSTAYLKEQGFEQVYHLQGGILQYLEDVPKQESLWEGECFVFDQRVTVDHDLQNGKYEQCFACRHPISQEDMQSESYQPGVSCPHCIDDLTEDKRKRMEMRQKNLTLAKQRESLENEGAEPDFCA